MQRKALKQLNKVTQWTNEKVFSGEKTELSREFTQFEQEIDVKRIGIERLHATSMPYFDNITKIKQTADPQPPAGSGKDKILYTEALGLVMIDYGGELRDDYGDALSKYGRSRCKMAIAQEEFGARLNEGYIAGMESVNDYKTFRKKLDSRRLALDAALNKLNSVKKEKDRAVLEAEVELARERFDEIEEETYARMQALQNESEQPFQELGDLLEAELEYHSKCKEILEDLKNSWPSGSRLSTSISTRPRAGTTSSSRSIASRGTPRQSRLALDSDDEAPNRHRSGSTSSMGRGTGFEERTPTGKDKKKGFMAGFGSFGKKSGMTISKPRRDRDAQTLNSTDEESGFGGPRNGYGEEEDEDEDEDGFSQRYQPRVQSPRDAFAANGRTRSGSVLSGKGQGNAYSPTMSTTRGLPPALKRTNTSPAMGTAKSNARFVKALYDYPTDQPDELELRVGQIIQVVAEISQDWYTGESEGRSGMFPVQYTEPCAEPHTTLNAGASPSVPLPPRRLPPSNGSSAMTTTRSLPPFGTASLAPPAPGRMQSSTMSGYNSMNDTSDSEAEGYVEDDSYATASLSGNAQSQGNSSSNLAAMALGSAVSPRASAGPGLTGRSRSSTVNSISGSGSGAGPGKRAPPPPPPGRRSASSINVLGAASVGSSGQSSPRAGPGAPIGRSPFAVPADTRVDHTTASPFGGEESEEELQIDHGTTAAPFGARPMAGAGMTRAMSGLQLPSANSATLARDRDRGGCRDGCGCDEFKQNLFKPEGHCASCYHVHD